MSTAELQPSKLGTKEHWDKVYEEELANFEELGDEGEVWYETLTRFGTESVEKMVEWSLENYPPKENGYILEVGSGNGILLFELAEAGYDPSRLYGIDYSAGAVALSKEIGKTKDKTEITFSESDFLRDEPQKPSGMEGTGVWDLIMDKGTYDAIALGEKDDKGHSPAANYPNRVARLLKEGGYFLITSCNFTEEELKNSFIVAGTDFEYHSRIQHPTFSFGGKSGSICSSVAFKKVSSTKSS